MLVHLLRFLVGFFVVGIGALHAEETNLLVGADSAPRGRAFLVKEFSVPPGATVAGVRFHNNDKTTTFPSLLVLRGPADRISAASELVRLEEVRPGRTNSVDIAIPPLTDAVNWTILLVAIELPSSSTVSGPGSGAGIAAKQLDGVGTSYFASGVDGDFGIMDVEYAIELLFAGGNKAKGPIPRVSGVRAQPNPFNPQVAIELAVPRKGQVRVDVYDVAGRFVCALLDRELASGTHTKIWDGRDSNGRVVATGIYLARVSILGDEFSLKLAMTK